MNVSPPAPALSIVLPVYNEAALLPAVVAEWLSALARLEADLSKYTQAEAYFTQLLRGGPPSMPVGR